MITAKFFKKMIGLNANENAVGNGGGNIERTNNSNEPSNVTQNDNPENQEKMNDSENPGTKARIYNLIIVDESGSMSGLEHATVTGVNETINSIRGAQKEFAETQEHFLTLVTFDFHGSEPVRTLINREPIGNVKDFDNYHPRGCTPLYDAMGQSITDLYNHIKDDDDASAVVTVLTDGLENASREWSGANLKALIEKLTQEGWSFSYMGSDHDVKQVSFNLSIHNVVEFDHDIVGSANTWSRESSAKLNFFRRMNEEYRKGRRQSKEEWIRRKREMAKDYYGDRVTPEHVDQLRENEIFVFGSNTDGAHNGGAANVAMALFGAQWGQSEGLQGRSYAIPTTCPLGQMAEAVQRFTVFAEQHPELRFLVTRVGCGVAGHTVNEVAPMFKGCINLENVTLPVDFWKTLGLKM